MADYIFLSFAFSAGLTAFFSPCAITLLPGFITYFLSKYYPHEKFGKGFSLSLLIKGISFGLFAILGFFTVFGITGAVVIILGNFIKQFIPWIAIITGFVLIIIGIFMLLGKPLMLSFHLSKRYQGSNYKIESYFFGIAYAIAALGCTFPLFISVVLQSFLFDTIVEKIFPLLWYIVGMSIMMMFFTILTTISKNFMYNKLKKIMPYIHKISGLVLIGAGIYIIYWQTYVL